MLSIFESGGAPFSFTLYPGGGLHLKESECDAKLKRVGASELLDAVITTQTTTHDYVLQKGFFPEEKVHFIYGGIHNSPYFEEQYIQHKKYSLDKGPFDICFVATRYEPRGVSKGYDVFLEVAKRPLPYNPDIRFHIVGDSQSDVQDELDTSFLGDRVVEYGSRDLPFFPEFYSQMDMILSPNKPFSNPLYPSAFDGFPTGCCIEAGMCGTAVLCTDLFNNNVAFTDGEDIRIIPYDVDGICDIVISYFDDPEALYRLGENCRSSFLRVFGIEEQMSQRMSILLEPQNL